MVSSGVARLTTGKFTNATAPNTGSTFFAAALKNSLLEEASSFFKISFILIYVLIDLRLQR
jgi:hypothetical protein